MTKIIKILRNNWKKSVFGTGLVAYGINYGLNIYHVGMMMKVFCEEAEKFGDNPVEYGQKHRRITVILNPAANKRKAKKNFEKYCAPLLYLSGAFVSILETEKEGHAKQLFSKIDPDTDAIVVAGGDGTLSETITGLMRSKGEFCHIPIGVLPLGKTNTLANNMFGEENKNNIKQMAEATMAVVRGNTKPIDTLRIEPIDNVSQEQKPIYGVAGVEWGMWRDVKKQQDKLWFFGPLRNYASLIFPGHAIERSIDAQIRYTSPCPGCSQCYNQRPDLLASNKVSTETPRPVSRWWNRLKLQDRAKHQGQAPLVEPVDYMSVINESCTDVKEKEIKCADVTLTVINPSKIGDGDPHRLLLSVGPKTRYQGQFLSDGLKYIKGETATIADLIEAKQIEIRPNGNSLLKSQEKDKGEHLSIDSEDYEVRPIRVTVLPNSVKMFYPPT